jgi:hypothetical protein
MVTFNGALFPRTLSRFEGTAPYAIQPLYAAPINVAALSVLILYPKTSANPMALLGFSDFAALPLERDRLLDLLCGYVGLTIPEHFHESIRITSGTELVDVLRTQPHPVNAWAAKDTCLIAIEKRPFFIGIGTPSGYWQIRVRGCRKLLADDRTATNFALPRKMHTCIFKIRRKKFTLAAAFRKKVVENSVGERKISSAVSAALRGEKILWADSVGCGAVRIRRFAVSR